MKEELKSSNGALARVLQGAAQDQSVGTSVGYPAPYGSPGYTAPQARTMTIDDVVVRTIILLGLTGLVGAASWILLPPTNPLMYPVLMAAALIGLVLGLVIAFKRVTNPLVISAYAVAQGVMLGLVSRVFEDLY